MSLYLTPDAQNKLSHPRIYTKVWKTIATSTKQYLVYSFVLSQLARRDVFSVSKYEVMFTTSPCPCWFWQISGVYFKVTFPKIKHLAWLLKYFFGNARKCSIFIKGDSIWTRVFVRLCSVIVASSSFFPQYLSSKLCYWNILKFALWTCHWFSVQSQQVALFVPSFVSKEENNYYN